MTARPLSEPTVHWLGCDGKTHLISFQGSLFVWKVLQRPGSIPPPGKRGVVSGFSAAARFRMLKLVATIDWKEAWRPSFITTTYRDQDGLPNRRKLNLARQVFWRYVEKHVGKHVCTLWRIEWKQRLSGRFKGEIMPHYHFLPFKFPWIDRKKIDVWWKNAVGSDLCPRTQIKRMRDEAQVGYYVSKYAAKTDDTVLVNPAYHNRPTGRDWGVLRKELLPVHEEKEVRVAGTDQLEALRAELVKHWPEANLTGYESFTLLGPLAQKAGKTFFGNFVDCSDYDDYNPGSLEGDSDSREFGGMPPT